MNIGYTRTEDPARYGAVILAAGLSSRMKDFKPLLPVDGQPAIAGLAETLHSAGISDIVAVTGHRREDLTEVVREHRLTESYNAQYTRGMFSSIQAGLAKAVTCWPEKKGFFLVPVDCPLITIRAIRELMAAADGSTPTNAPGNAPAEAAGSSSAAPEHAADACFYVPTFEGKKGHPLLVPMGRVQQILDYDGDGGLKAITDAAWEQMIRVPVPDEEILLDMDTPEHYEALQHFVAKGCRREKLSVLSSRKRIILVRHGQTRQHQEPMFIGQYDVELAEEGRRQAEAAGAALAQFIEPDVRASASWVEGISVGKEPLPPIEAIYTSDLTRAKETAQIIAEQINAYYAGGGPEGEAIAEEVNLMNAMAGFGMPRAEAARAQIHVEVKPYEGLRELNLGDWDGQPIRRMREEAPELYARRGEDLFAFKTGNDAENFYDMQYRAVAALRDILEDDYARNVIIVAHSGVIRALENNLRGLRVDDDWEPLEKGSYRIWTSA